MRQHEVKYTGRLNPNPRNEACKVWNLWYHVIYSESSKISILKYKMDRAYMGAAQIFWIKNTKCAVPTWGLAKFFEILDSVVFTDGLYSYYISDVSSSWFR